MVMSLKRGVEAAEAFVEQADEEVLLGSPTALWKTALKRLFRRKTGVVGLCLVGLMMFTALAAPILNKECEKAGL